MPEVHGPLKRQLALCLVESLGDEVLEISFFRPYNIIST